MFLLAVFILGMGDTTALVGYDCGTPALNITTVSLLDVGECNIVKETPTVTEVYIRLLQFADFGRIQVQQCKISIKRSIYYCGMHSHISVVINGQAEYILETTRNNCEEMHATGRYIYGTTGYITGLRINSTTSRSMTLAGTIGSDGSCQGVHYSDPYGSWDNVIVQAIITITLQTNMATVYLETNQVHLRSGQVCQYLEENCMDVEGGYTYWRIIPESDCKYNRYDTLYEGQANRMVETSYEGAQTIYSLSTGDVTFALAKRGEEHVCGYTMITTEHPRLHILEGETKTAFNHKRRLDVQNVDLFTYINSKFIYVEKHLKSQMQQLYRDVLYQKCSLEQQILKNALSIATQSPDEFAYHFMKGPGYMAVLAGEVVHIIKCIPVEVKIEHKEECYQQLPVKKGEYSYFLSPRTHILMEKGTQVNCNVILPTMYSIGNGWYKINPRPVEAIKPIIIQPMTRPTWTYVNPGSLATSGIYTNEDLKGLREYIMSPAERPAILNTLVREVTGEESVKQGVSYTHLFDEDTLERVAESTWKKIWGSFSTFGTASAGLIGIYFLIRTGKLIIDTVIHGYAIHSIYGWSIYLIGAIWDSITNLLIYLGSKQHKVPKESSPEEPNDLIPQRPLKPQVHSSENIPGLSYQNTEQTTQNETTQTLYPALKI